MKTSLSAPNAAERKRFRAMQEIGCLAHIMLGHHGVPGDIHHLLSGGRRVSHQVTVCLSPWHHRGVPPGGMNDRQAEKLLGPSLAKSPRAFHKRFGSDMELLEMQNRLIEEYVNATKV